MFYCVLYSAGRGSVYLLCAGVVQKCVYQSRSPLRPVPRELECLLSEFHGTWLCKCQLGITTHRSQNVVELVRYELCGVTGKRECVQLAGYF